METMMSLQSPQTEKALLGALVLQPDTLAELDITPDDFYSHAHRMIFNALDALVQRQETVDYVTLCAELDKRKQLGEIGGPAFITSFYTQPGMSWAAESYARELREKRRRRELVALANQIAQSAYDQQTDINQCIPGFVNGLVTASAVNQGAQHIGETMRGLMDDVEERMKNPAEIWGIPTGFPTFDKVTGGLQHGELMILAGTPGVGKSILGMNFAAGMAKHAPGAIYSMEMKKAQVARRLVSGRAKVQTRNMKTGRVTDAEYNRFIEAVEQLSQLDVYIADSQGWTTTSLRADLARLKALYGIEWFVLDYLFLLDDGGKDEIERTAAASKGLKRATSELDLAGIAIHSLNKTGMDAGRRNETGGDGLPNGLGDLRGSGQVAYDADLACFLTRFSPDTLPDLSVPGWLKDYTRVLWFGKGRELENPKQYVPFQQKTDVVNNRITGTYPEFVEVTEKE